jgi:hypothetical protein
MASASADAAACATQPLITLPLPALAAADEGLDEEARAGAAADGIAPVRILSIRDVARLALAKKRTADGGAHGSRGSLDPGGGGGGASEPHAFVARDAVDHPWRGRRETWYDYLSTDARFCQRWVRLYLPARLCAVVGGTVGLALALRGDALLAAQVGALSAPVSAFSLLTSLILTFRHSVAYARFWDAKGFVARVLASLRVIAFAFLDAPLAHRREACALCAALFDSFARALCEDVPTDAALFERSPPGPWRACARAALPARLRARLALTPGSLAASVCGELAVCEATRALEPGLRGMVLGEVVAVAKATAACVTLSATPVPPIYTIMLQVTRHASLPRVTVTSSRARPGRTGVSQAWLVPVRVPPPPS